MEQHLISEGNILGIDVGDRRIGLACAHSLAKLPRPVSIIKNDKSVLNELAKVINEENIVSVVVGLPRDALGQETAQSEVSRKFAGNLKEFTKLPVYLADESLSSVRAESDKTYQRTSSKHYDDVAACYILEEFFERNDCEKI